MPQKILNKAAEVLNIGAIFLRGSKVYCHEDFFNEQPSEAVLRQSFHSLRGIKEELVEKDDAESFIYKYLYSFGVRLIDSKLEESDKDFVLVEITADFEAHYISKEKLDEEVIKTFGELNVCYNAWPYWREYVQNTCARTGIATIVIPFFTELQKCSELDSKKAT